MLLRISIVLMRADLWMDELGGRQGSRPERGIKQTFFIFVIVQSKCQQRHVVFVFDLMVFTWHAVCLARSFRFSFMQVELREISLLKCYERVIDYMTLNVVMALRVAGGFQWQHFACEVMQNFWWRNSSGTEDGMK